jgi:hypothetical protein
MNWLICFLRENSEVTAALIGAVVGAAIILVADWMHRRRRKKAHWRAVSAEVEFCRTNADIYKNDDVMAPLYRLPTLIYVNSFPQLLVDGAVEESEASAIVKFYCEVETLNRGLDQAQEARGNGDLLNAEYNRNLLKAGRLTSSGELYLQVRKLIDRHI